MLVSSAVTVELEAFVLSEESNPLVEILGATRALGFGPPGGGGGKDGAEPTFGDADADGTCANSLLLDCAECSKSGDNVVAALIGVPF